jgi:ribosomal protein S18 acetylase RimI-like enzyme
MSDNVQVQRAGLAQIDDATRLFQGYLAFYEKSVDAADARRFIEDRLRNQDSVIYLASLGRSRHPASRDTSTSMYVDRRALGFVQLYPSFASLSLARSWILNDLFVDPSARGHGVGEALMEAARKLGAETSAAEIFLQTARSNATAQRLYQRLGYQRDDEFLVYTLSMPKP